MSSASVTPSGPTADSAAGGQPLLHAGGLRASYGDVESLHGLDFSIAAGEIVTILGANGAGKTTTLRAISQLVRTSGELALDGVSIIGRQASEIVRMGVAHVPQGRGTLADLSVQDNLKAGGYTQRGPQVSADMDLWYSTFPRLAERRRLSAGQLSGGEQQMLAISRAMMSRPRLLLLDEPSLGLAPVIVSQLFDVLSRVNAEQHTTMIIVEQNTASALDLARRGYVLEAGVIVTAGTAAGLRADDSVRQAYLGY
jgi:branched-chain amino acid transport system ATP-binding protein